MAAIYILLNESYFLIIDHNRPRSARIAQIFVEKCLLRPSYLIDISENFHFYVFWIVEFNYDSHFNQFLTSFVLKHIFYLCVCFSSKKHKIYVNFNIHTKKIKYNIWSQEVDKQNKKKFGSIFKTNDLRVCLISRVKLTRLGYNVSQYFGSMKVNFTTWHFLNFFIYY